MNRIIRVRDMVYICAATLFAIILTSSIGKNYVDSKDAQLEKGSIETYFLIKEVREYQDSVITKLDNLIR